jgi:hypothetical protein
VSAILTAVTIVTVNILHFPVTITTVNRVLVLTTNPGRAEGNWVTPAPLLCGGDSLPGVMEVVRGIQEKGGSSENGGD